MIYKFKRNRVYRSYFGGKRLDTFLGESDPRDSRFPEEWIASTVKAINIGRENIIEGPSTCEDGRSLSDIIADDPRRVLGEAPYLKHGAAMSMLVKLLDAAERLFIQCHPTVAFAEKYFGSSFGKTECWYMLDCEKDACVYLGFKPGITKEKLKACFEVQDIEGMLGLMHKLPVRPGDLVFVDGGVPHAIGGGCLLCELQEPTDYMVIPERTSASGITLADEKMHGGLGFERMFDCFEYRGYTEKELRDKYVSHPECLPDKLTPIVDKSLTDKFRMDCLSVRTTVGLNAGGVYCVLVVISGECTVTEIYGTRVLTKGDELFVTADTGELTFDGNADILILRP